MYIIRSVQSAMYVLQCTMYRITESALFMLYAIYSTIYNTLYEYFFVTLASHFGIILTQIIARKQNMSFKLQFFMLNATSTLYVLVNVVEHSDTRNIHVI